MPKEKVFHMHLKKKKNLSHDLVATLHLTVALVLFLKAVPVRRLVCAFAEFKTVILF